MDTERFGSAAWAFVALLLGTLLGCEGADIPVKKAARDDDTGRLFLDSHNPKSNRFAILEDNGSSCWLYLTETGSQRPEKDCFVYSPVEPAQKLNMDAVRESGDPPILTKEVASATAVLRDPLAEEFSIVWATDGESVAVVRREEPVAMIVRDEKRGYSKALAKSSFFGEPWEESTYARYFK